MKSDRKINGTLILEKVEFTRILVKKATKNNKSSSKITLPKDFEGKEVYILIPKSKK